MTKPKPIPTKIVEEQHVHDAWYAQANKMQLSELPEFLRHLTEDYVHDYGTICHAVAAGAVAAAWAVERSPVGGITGFQAGAIMWEFIKHWMSFEDRPLRLLDYSDMLYPQYEHKFTQISPEVWKWLQDEAKKNLDGDREHVHPAVQAHWASIVDGRVPFKLDVGDN